jgi:hypothetical protein
MASKEKKRQRCPFPKCRRYAEHDGNHSLRTAKRTARKVSAKSLANLKPPFQPGQSGNPGGRPKRDVAAEIAAAIFENNEEAIGKAYLKLLKRGSLGAFSLLSDRAFGKVAQPLVGGGEGANPIVVKIDC